MVESEEEIKNLWMRVKDKIEKPSLELTVQKIKIVASGLITPRQIEGENVEIMTYFIFQAPKSLWMVTAALKLKDTCSLKGKLSQS